MGNRFAREGIGTVVISYRLAPKHPHPAQIEDAAAAFAWAVKNIEKYGGRADRIFVGGHSAGGHLAALLALDPRYLAARGLSQKNIRGVVAMSGVYEIRGQESVFGADPAGKRWASPMTYVAKTDLPFLVTYCEWDYATLPLQARRFHEALHTAGVPARLLYVPGENHISEMVHIVDEKDPTARAILQFIGP